MSARGRPRGKKAGRAKPPATGPLARRVARLAAALAAERQRHARQLAAMRRATDRRLAALVREIAGLRHHQARAEGLARLLAERDARLSTQAQRLGELESLLQAGTPLR